jgi:hypothetical protein
MWDVEKYVANSGSQQCWLFTQSEHENYNNKNWTFHNWANVSDIQYMISSCYNIMIEV